MKKWLQIAPEIPFDFKIVDTHSDCNGEYAREIVSIVLGYLLLLEILEFDLESLTLRTPTLAAPPRPIQDRLGPFHFLARTGLRYKV